MGDAIFNFTLTPIIPNGSAAPGSQSGGRADMIIVDIDTDILIDAARCTYFLIGGILQTVWCLGRF